MTYASSVAQPPMTSAFLQQSQFPQMPPGTSYFVVAPHAAAYASGQLYYPQILYPARPSAGPPTLMMPTHPPSALMSPQSPRFSTQFIPVNALQQMYQPQPHNMANGMVKMQDCGQNFVPSEGSSEYVDGSTTASESGVDVFLPAGAEAATTVEPTVTTEGNPAKSLETPVPLDQIVFGDVVNPPTSDRVEIVCERRRTRIKRNRKPINAQSESTRLTQETPKIQENAAQENIQNQSITDDLKEENDKTPVLSVDNSTTNDSATVENAAVECAETEDINAKRDETEYKKKKQPNEGGLKSWASIVRTKNYEAVVVNSIDVGPIKAAEKRVNIPNVTWEGARVVNPKQDQMAKQLKEQLSTVRIVHRGPYFQPRGLYNDANFCYVNAVLQALIACPPFFNLMKNFKATSTRTATSTPILDALSRFVDEFQHSAKGKFRRSSNLDYGQAFSADYIREMVSRLKSDAAYKGRQEDAEELLLALLNGLQDEMIGILQLDEAGESAANNETCSISNGNMHEEDEWKQVVGGRKHAITTRQVSTTDTPLSRTFMGYLRNCIRRGGNTKETANVEPFFTLPLEIQSSEVTSVITALSHTLASETVKTTTLSSTGKASKEVQMQRHAAFQQLPAVLILQLKYFLYSNEEIKKLLKPIVFTTDLFIDKDVIFSTGKSQIQNYQRKYKLFAVVLHHGEKAMGGHYTARVFHAGFWLNIDDNQIETLSESAVSECDSITVPYLLFYRRCDLMNQS